jgi:hypothetical protein
MHTIAAVLLTVLAVGCIDLTPAYAQRISLTARAGSPGVGGDVAVGLSPHFNARAGLTYFSYNHVTTETIEDVDLGIDATANLFGLSAIVDYYPWKTKSFHLSAGAVYNGNLIEASAVAAGPYEVGSLTFTADDIGGLDGEISFNSIAPYAGLGFGNATKLGSRLGFLIDLGAIYHQSPRVELTGTGMVSPTAEQAPQLEENLSSFQLVPVISLGLSYRLTGK